LPENAIECKDLTVTFGMHTALNSINIQVPKGAFVSVIGPNGGGKSTLIKALLGLVRPDSGSISIFGRQASELPAEWTGYVPQTKTIDRTFPALPIELVVTGIKGSWVGRLSRQDREQAMAALERVGAAHLENRPLSRLSGGELQRVYLARILVRKPRILLLDEPATGIDTAGEKDMTRLLEEFRREFDTTILMVTHDWEAAYHHADYVMLLNKSLIGFDKPDKAFSEDSIRTLFGHLGHAHEIFFGVKKHE
jgi:zinc transport system ATP-binding protein